MSEHQQRQQSRLVTVDAVRALALMGVLVMNLRAQSGLPFLPEVQYDAIQSGLDRALDFLLVVLVDKKALSAFSFLFGLSFSLLLDSARRKGGSFVPMYLRRLFFLGLFGVVNFSLFYWGDILLIYAVLGVLLLVAHKLPQRSVLAIAAFLLFGMPLLLAIAGSTAFPALREKDIATLAIFQSADWTQTVTHSFNRYVGLVDFNIRDTFGDWNYTNILGLFLLGLWTARARIPHELDRHEPLLRRVALIAVPTGIALNTAGVLLGPGSPLATSMLIGIPTLAVGYLASAALLLKRPAAAPVRDALAPVGKTALTNYLAYGLIGQLIFYGWALGMMGRASTLEVILAAALLYLALMLLWHLWLQRFRMGPAEWLWRCLTQLERQPLRREQSVAT